MSAWLGPARTRLRAALVLVGVLLGATRAQGTVRWELRPKVAPTNSFSHPLPLADGRLLVCTETDESQRCHVLDPASNEQKEVPVSGPGHRFESALALDDGQLLLAHEHALLDVFSGRKRPLPPTAHPLSELRGVTIAGGRAAFVTTARCERVLFFMGVEVGFREVVAAPAGFCVRDVFDLGDGRVLMVRERAPDPSDDGYVDFIAFDLASSRFQLGPSLDHRSPRAAFVHRGEIVVLLNGYERTPDGGIRSEALFIDRSMKKRQLVSRPARARISPSSGAPGRPTPSFTIAGKCSLLCEEPRCRRARKSLPTQRAPSPSPTRSQRPSESTRSWPRARSIAVASTWSAHGASPIAFRCRSKRYCSVAKESRPGRNKSRRGQLRVHWEVQRLLERRRDLAQAAGPLLREAQKAEGFDTLRMALCTSHATGDLARACTEVASDREKDSRPSPPNKDRPRLARNLAIATGVIGGLAALAYADRDGGGGRAIAVGSGIAGGATLGFVGTIAFSKSSSELSGLGTLLLATAVGAGGAIAGGALATHTSRDPGDARFASAAVPLGGVWLLAVGLTLDKW